MTDLSEIISFALFIVSALWIHTLIVVKKDFRKNLSRIILFDLVALSIALLGLLSPETYKTFMQEDHVGEWTTFYAFVLTSLILTSHLWHSRRKGIRFFSSSFLIPLAVCAFCLVVAGEEISWGQRIFAFKPPDFFLEKNYQQELNVHNLFKGDGLLGIAIESKHLVMLTAFLYGILFPLLFRYIPPLKNLERYFPALYLMPYFVLVIVIGMIYPITFTAEACELYLGLLFLVHVYDAYSPHGLSAQRQSSPYRLYPLVISIFVLGAITIPVLNHALYGPDRKVEITIKEELKLLKDDFLNPKTIKKKMLRRKSIHKRIYTAIVQNYFRLPIPSSFMEHKKGEVRSTRKIYFLDPWYNPYWVYYSRKKQQVVFYSFGANRKRDSNLKGDVNLYGDDIGIVFNYKRMPS